MTARGGPVAGQQSVVGQKRVAGQKAGRHGSAGNGSGGADRLDVAVARKRLEEVLDELDRSVAVLGRSDQRSERGTDYPQDSADIGTNLAETDRSDAMLEAAQNRRVLVLDALRRLAEGRYGVCVDCGRPVPESRLKARPEAARCLKCQAAWDHARR